MPTTLPHPTATILPLDSASDAAVCGQKAATLARLKTAGFHIPDGFVIPVGTEPDLGHLRAALNQIGAAA